MYSRMVLMVVYWRYGMPFDANGCVSMLINVDWIKWMYFCVNDRIFPGNEQQKVSLTSSHSLSKTTFSTVGDWAMENRHVISTSQDIMNTQEGCVDYDEIVVWVIYREWKGPCVRLINFQKNQWLCLEYILGRRRNSGHHFLAHFCTQLVRKL